MSRSLIAEVERLGAAVVGDDAAVPIVLPKLAEISRTAVDLDLILSTIFALGACWDQAAVPEIARFAHHADADVRNAVARKVQNGADGSSAALNIAASVLISLARDHNWDVRDAAMRSLAELPADTPEIREALAESLTDPEDLTVEKAVLGLAMRGDDRAYPATEEALAAGRVSRDLVAAAAWLGDARLLPRLDSMIAFIKSAARLCDPAHVAGDQELFRSVEHHVRSLLKESNLSVREFQLSVEVSNFGPSEPEPTVSRDLRVEIVEADGTVRSGFWWFERLAEIHESDPQKIGSTLVSQLLSDPEQA